MAAIRFVKAGGTFAPLDQLLTNRPDRGPAPPEITPRNSLTSRQMAVLSLLQQGKANKIIAYELAMSESTVKVHVRNIMRKMGATNRTQVAYKAQKLWNNAELVTA
jgi:DNA-binding NarL/FixJ family response regulator